jgi:hypothetical protein
MSLSDRYNRGDGRIQQMDKYLTELGDRLGNQWLDYTGLSRDRLTRGLYMISMIASLQHYMVNHDPQVLLFTVIALLFYTGGGQSKGGLTEQIQSEVAGLPRNTLAFLRLEIIGLGTFLLVIGLCEVLSTVIAPDPQPLHSGGKLLLGLTLFTLQLGEYIRRTNPPTRSGGGTGHGQLAHGVGRRQA